MKGCILSNRGGGGGDASYGIFWMTFFKDKVPPSPPSPLPPPPLVSLLVLECHGWVTLEFGLGHVVRDQAYCIILSFAHRTFRSVLVISSSNYFAINMSTTKRPISFIVCMCCLLLSSDLSLDKCFEFEFNKNLLFSKVVFL